MQSFKKIHAKAIHAKAWGKIVAVLGVVALGTGVALAGGPAAVGAALISYGQFDTATKQKVDNTRLFTAMTTTDQVITLVGGPIATNGTVLAGIDLTGFSGDFQAIVSGQIDRATTATTPDLQVQPQLSLWRDCDNDGVFEWQTGEGVMSPNATIPDQKDRSVTVTGIAKFRVNKACHTKVIAFAYDKIQGSSSSGQLVVAKGVTVTLIPYR